MRSNVRVGNPLFDSSNIDSLKPLDPARPNDLTSISNDLCGIITAEFRIRFDTLSCCTTDSAKRQSRCGGARQQPKKLSSA